MPQRSVVDAKYRAGSCDGRRSICRGLAIPADNTSRADEAVSGCRMLSGSATTAQQRPQHRSNVAQALANGAQHELVDAFRGMLAGSVTLRFRLQGRDDDSSDGGHGPEHFIHGVEFIQRTKQGGGPGMRSWMRGSSGLASLHRALLPFRDSERQERGDRWSARQGRRRLIPQRLSRWITLMPSHSHILTTARPATAM